MQPRPSEPCPDDDAFAAFLERRVTADERVAFESHIDACARCFATVAELARRRPPTETLDDPHGAAWDRPHTALTVLGRYRILDPLGSGGMGIVYRGLDVQLQRAVALKIVNPATVDDDPSLAQARLHREALAMARFEHPNAVRIYDVGHTPVGLFIAMELVEGPTLGEWLRTARSRPWTEILDMFVKAGAALAAAHAVGIVHRDFKPDNVLIDRAGEPRVGDFGLAAGELGSSTERLAIASTQPANTLTRTGAVLGSPAYMSPEQHDGLTADARSDQFAFCVSLWEGLFGQRPFRGRTVAAVRRAVEAGAPEPPPRREIPRALVQALARGLSVDPQARFPDMDRLLNVLGRARQRSRARPWLLATLVGAAIIAAIALGSAHGDRAPAPPRADASQLDVRAQAVAALRKAETLEAVGRNEAALQEAERAALLASNLDDDRLLAEARLLEFWIAGGIGTAPERAQTARRAAQVATARAAAPDLDAQLHQITASYLHEVGRFAEAVSEAEAAVRILERLHPEPHVELAKALATLGKAQLDRGDREPGRRAIERALQIARVALSEDDARLETFYNDAGIAAAAAGDYRRAAALMRRSLAISDRLGADLPSGAKTRANLAVALMYLGEADAALREAMAALEVQRRNPGPDHLDTASTEELVGSLLLFAGRSDEATLHLERALVVVEATLGPDNATLVELLGSLGSASSRVGDHERALEVFTRADRIASTIPEQAVRARCNLASALVKAGRASEALALTSAAIAGLTPATSIPGKIAVCWFASARAIAAIEGNDATQARDHAVVAHAYVVAAGPGFRLLAGEVETFLAGLGP